MCSPVVNHRTFVKCIVLLTLINPLTSSRSAWKVHTRFYHVRAAAYPIHFRSQRADHSSIPDGSIPSRPFLAPYDDSTSPGSSPGYPESATSDQRRLQARPTARFGTSAHGGDDSADVAYRYCAQGNHRRQVDLRAAWEFGRRLSGSTGNLACAWYVA